MVQVLYSFTRSDCRLQSPAVDQGLVIHNAQLSHFSNNDFVLQKINRIRSLLQVSRHTEFQYIAKLL